MLFAVHMDLSLAPNTLEVFESRSISGRILTYVTDIVQGKVSFNPPKPERDRYNCAHHGCIQELFYWGGGQTSEIVKSFFQMKSVKHCES